MKTEQCTLNLNGPSDRCSNHKSVPIVTLKMVREGSVKYRQVCSKQDVASIVEYFLKDSAIERLVIVGLDSQNRPTIVHSFNGTVNQCAAYPATILKLLLLSNSTSFIIAHNHPGDSLTASDADWTFVTSIKIAAKSIDISLLDSLVFNSDGTNQYSMRESPRWNSND